MSTHHTEIGKDHGHPESAALPIHTQDTVEEQRVQPLQTAPAQLATSMYRGLIDPQGRLYTNATPTAGSTIEIWRYDPAAGTWSRVTAVPEEGSLLAVTLTGGNGHVALWFLLTAQGKWILYRYEM